MTTILLDTNAYTAFKQGRADALDIVQRAAGIAISSVVLGELCAGFAVGSREVRNRAELQQFLAAARVVVLPVDEQTAQYDATVYKGLKSKGRPIPTNDMWIAAIALQHSFAVFTYDGHFKYVDGITAGVTVAELAM